MAKPNTVGVEGGSVKLLLVLFSPQTDMPLLRLLEKSSCRFHVREICKSEVTQSYFFWLVILGHVNQLLVFSSREIHLNVWLLLKM